VIIRVFDRPAGSIRPLHQGGEAFCEAEICFQNVDGDVVDYAESWTSISSLNANISRLLFPLRQSTTLPWRLRQLLRRIRGR